MNWPIVSIWRHERELRRLQNIISERDVKIARLEEAVKGRDGRSYEERNQGTVSVPVEAVKIAWKIAKERRDEALVAPSVYEEAERDLEVLHEAGFDSFIPTLAEIRGIWRES